MTDVFAQATEFGVVPVIAIEDAAHAVGLADALSEGGLPIAEITFRTAAASAVMETLQRERPDFLVGAGTVLDIASLEAAHRTGARFGLSPGFDAEIVDRALAMGFAFAPGIMTPSELGAAAKRGLRLCKFFPAGTAGGPNALAGISAPFAHLGIRFIPTGGVTEATIGDWLKLPSVAAVGGTWIARTEDIREGRWADITRKARSAVAAVRAFRGA
jgi:2-dehydro-3-deoxyphosphogluconate aldolase/(4S)-4-hydroxy-2-oxoglutarate aldolase